MKDGKLEPGDIRARKKRRIEMIAVIIIFGGALIFSIYTSIQKYSENNNGISDALSAVEDYNEKYNNIQKDEGITIANFEDIPSEIWIISISLAGPGIVFLGLVVFFYKKYTYQNHIKARGKLVGVVLPDEVPVSGLIANIIKRYAMIRSLSNYPFSYNIVEDLNIVTKSITSKYEKPVLEIYIDGKTVYAYSIWMTPNVKNKDIGTEYDITYFVKKGLVEVNIDNEDFNYAIRRKRRAVITFISLISVFWFGCSLLLSVGVFFIY